MKNRWMIVALALVAGLVGGLVGLKLLGGQGVGVAHKESAYERVMRTGVIRCGYATYDYLLSKDAATGQLSGMFYDVMNELAQELDLKIEWGNEIGYGDIEAAYAAGKFDLFCNAVFPTPKRAKYGLFSVPLYYDALVTYVRADDHRFDRGLEKLNDPQVKLAVRDGDLTDMVADKMFPKAQKISSPQLEDFSQMLVDVQHGKADATFFGLNIGNKFLMSNPGSVRVLFADQPVFLSPVTMMLPQGDVQLKSMLDVTLTKMVLNGKIEQLLHKHTGNSKNFWLVPKPVR